MSTITVRPSQVQANRSSLQRLFCTLAGAGWTSGTTFTISGVSGVIKVSQIVDSATQAYVVITTAGSGAGTLTVSDGTHTQGPRL